MFLSYKGGFSWGTTTAGSDGAAWARWNFAFTDAQNAFAGVESQYTVSTGGHFGAGAGWLIRIGPVSHQYRISDLRSPCHSVADVHICGVQMSYLSHVRFLDSHVGSAECFVGHLRSVISALVLTEFFPKTNLKVWSVFRTETGPLRFQVCAFPPQALLGERLRWRWRYRLTIFGAGVSRTRT